MRQIGRLFFGLQEGAVRANDLAGRFTFIYPAILAGTLAGVLAAIFNAPSELVKCSPLSPYPSSPHGSKTADKSQTYIRKAHINQPKMQRLNIAEFSSLV